MRSRAKILGLVGAAALGVAVVSASYVVTGSAGAAQPSTVEEFQPAMVEGVARDLRMSVDEARKTLREQEAARVVRKRLPQSLVDQSAGMWFDERTGKLTVAVTDQAAAKAARAAGAEAKVVGRGQAELDRITARVTALAAGVPGVNGHGVDVTTNDVLVRINRTKKTPVTERFVAAARALGGVRIEETDTSPVQQAGEVNPGDGWWPGSETPCSVGVGATDSAGTKYLVTAGHCTNDVNQAAYGQSGQQNRLGTVNPGGGKSINGPEGDMGLVAVTEAGWTLSAAVNTWGQPAVAVTGSKDAIVGETVCHSGNTAPNWECGRVTKLNHTMVYNNGSLTINGLTVTTACSQGGDSGGVWLSGDKAVGLHEGGINGNNCPTGDNAVFQPLNEALTKWNLTLFTGGDTQAPTAPGNARSTGTTTSSVSLAWDASTDNVGVTGYEVFNGGSLATTVTGTSATVSGLAADTSYTFTVKAKDAAGNSSAASAAVSARTQPGGGGDDEPPTTPGNLRATGVTDTTASLSWDAAVDNVGVTGYDVFNGTTLAASVAGSSATVSGLTANTTYSFTVQAKDAAGNKSKPTVALSVKTTGTTGGRTFSNDADFPIRDFQVLQSKVTSTAAGAAANPVTVKVTATHTCLQDLQITLVSPSGRWYTLQRYGDGGWQCTPFGGQRTFTVVPASGEAASGQWTLRIGDNGPGDTGVLDTWSVTV
ncbi:fibronectin type III domain-containing protein [Actinokineospora sp. HUAS TT18]|uniref:fibronectin type III domain-containing protein n=1 Tax=Actinokineospora sp. HUAS TT18 TaxID=3447451 RepID=UPI003F521B7F